jgi:DeoR family suf operon transcriptional repressor
MEMNGPDALSGFPQRQRDVLHLLKRQPDRSLEEVARALGISKVAALRHLHRLEERALVSRALETGARGRPRVRFRLRASTASLFPQGYQEIAGCALRFVEARLGREAVVELLRDRAREVARRERHRFEGKDLVERASTLVRLREEMGYMAGSGPRRPGAPLTILEHNCPILSLAREYGEACEVERELFEDLLGARVEAQHRVVAGDPVCRFVVHPRGGP